MRSIISAVVVPLMLSACAPTAQGVPERRTERSLAMVRADGEVQLTRESSITAVTVPAKPSEVWRAMPEIYAALDLTVTTSSNAARVVESVRRGRRIAGRNMAAYFECPGPYGNLATSGDVFLTARSQVLAEGEGSQVRHEVAASARQATGRNNVPCTSKGTLEALLGEMVTKRFPPE